MNRTAVSLARIAAAALALASAAGAQAAVELVANGGFETGDFSGWTAAIGPFSGVDGSAAHGGAFGVFGGEPDAPGTLAQDLATVAGTAYDIRLWLRSDGETPSVFRVRFGGVTLLDATDLGAFDYTAYSFSAVATSALSTLEIGFRSDNGFLEFDDVSVQAAAVPEPASALLAAAGLAGLAVRRRLSGALRRAAAAGG